jgi:hypothetical protein
MSKTGTVFRDIGKVIKWMLIVGGALLLVILILSRMVVTTGNTAMSVRLTSHQPSSPRSTLE